MSVVNKIKGDFGGLCNVTRCQSSLGVTWYNLSTRKYYCGSCAAKINYDFMSVPDNNDIEVFVTLCVKELKERDHDTIKKAHYKKQYRG